jgi:aldose sugar dehydrogenase
MMQLFLKFRYIDSNTLHLTLFVIVVSTLILSACEAAGNTEPIAQHIINTEYQTLILETVMDNLEHPWSVAFLPDGRYLITERSGRLLIIDGNTRTPVQGLPDIHAVGQGGLLDVVLHPNFEENSHIYLTYSKPDGNGYTALALCRAKLENTRLIDLEDVYIQNRYSGPGRHYGSRLAWMNDGSLLISIGDRGAEPLRAQDREDHAGTVLRLNDDGTVPDDNPFADSDTGSQYVFSYGHRNIQGLVVDLESGMVWATDHGPRGGDLLVNILAGHNYGWPIVTQGLDYRTQEPYPFTQSRRKEGITPHTYDFGPTLAPSGLALITAAQFRQWQGNLLAGGLRSERIRRLVLQKHDESIEVIHDEELLPGRIGRIRDVREGPDGNVYILTDLPDGALYRVKPR